MGDVASPEEGPPAAEEASPQNKRKEPNISNDEDISNDMLKSMNKKSKRKTPSSPAPQATNADKQDSSQSVGAKSEAESSDVWEDEKGSLKPAIKKTKEKINKLRSRTAKLFRVDNEEMLRGHKRMQQELSTLKRLELEQERLTAKMKFYDRQKKRTEEIKKNRQEILDTVHQEEVDRAFRKNFLHTEAGKMKVAMKEQTMAGVDKYKSHVKNVGNQTRKEKSEVQMMLEKNEKDRLFVARDNREKVFDMRKAMRQSVHDAEQRNLDIANSLKNYKNTALKRVKDERTNANDKTIDNFRRELKRKNDEFKARMAKNLAERNQLVKNMGEFSMHCRRTMQEHQQWRDDASKDNQARFRREWDNYQKERQRNLEERFRLNAENRKRLEKDLADMRFRLEDLVRAISSERAAAKMKAMREIELKELRHQQALERQLQKEYDELEKRGIEDRSHLEGGMQVLKNDEQSLIDKIAEMRKEADSTFARLVELQIGTSSVKFDREEDVPHGGIWTALELSVRPAEEPEQADADAEPTFKESSGPVDPQSIPNEEVPPAAPDTDKASDLDTTPAHDVSLEGPTQVAPNTV